MQFVVSLASVLKFRLEGGKCKAGTQLNSSQWRWTRPAWGYVRLCEWLCTYGLVFSSIESKMNMIHNVKLIEHIIEENCTIHEQATNTDALSVYQKGIYAITFN